MVSKIHRAIFIHIEKTGGTSIEQKLGLFETLARGVQDHSKLRYYDHISDLAYSIRNLKFALYCFRRGKFKKALFYLKNFIVPSLTRKQYNSYYKFTIVRNTWSRIYSYHYNIMRDQHLRRAYGIKGECTLFEFVNEYLDHKNFDQLNYITDCSGKISLNFIGRFEKLDLDFKKICSKLEIRDTELPKLLVIKGKSNYKNFYDERTKELVGKIYKKEIDYFDFKFDEGLLIR